MSILPSELLACVVDYLESEDLKTARLCNQQFADYATPPLFNTVVILFTRADFERLKLIAGSRNIRGHVRQLFYVGSRYPPGLSPEMWQLYYNRVRHAQMNALMWPRNPYEEYKRLSEEQRELTAAGVDKEVMETAVPMLVNLETVRVLMAEIFKPGHGLLHKLTVRTFCAPDGDFAADVSYPARISVYRYIGVRQAWTILAPIVRAGREISPMPRLQHLELDGINWKLFRDMSASPEPWKEAFSALKSLRLDLITTQRQDLESALGDEPLDVEGNTIQALVQAARNLETVDVTFLAAERCLLLVDIFAPGQVWNRLRVVKLKGITFDALQLQDFVRSHASSRWMLTLQEPDFQGPMAWEVYVNRLAGWTGPAENATWGPDHPPLEQTAHMTDEDFVVPEFSQSPFAGSCCVWKHRQRELVATWPELK